MALTPSPVKRYAQQHGLTVRQPAGLRHAEVQGDLLAIELDVLIVAAYGLILPQAVLAWPRHGCLNIHASLLPRWRGAAPIARAIEAGDAVTGITIMRMDAGLDTGPVVSQQQVPIDPRTTAGGLHDRLAEVGARQIVAALHALAVKGRLDGVPQGERGATYAAKLERADSVVDWRVSAEELDRKVRALSPAPGAVAHWRSAPFKIRSAVPLDGDVEGEPGAIVAVTPAGIDVVCGDARRRALLRLTELQPAGGRSMPAGAFAAGRGITAGARFDAAPAREE